MCILILLELYMCPDTTRAIQVTMQQMSRELDLLRAERQPSGSDAAVGGGGGGGRSTRCGDEEGAGDKFKPQSICQQAILCCGQGKNTC